MNSRKPISDPMARREFIFTLPLLMFGLSAELQAKQIQPIFLPGTCLAVSLLCGGYGAAIVLQLDSSQDEVRHLVGGLKGIYRELPTMDVFERREWLYLTHGKFKNTRHLVWCESSAYGVDSKHFKFTVAGTTKLRSEDPRVRILVKLATNNASKLAGDNASTCPLQKELQAES